MSDAVVYLGEVGKEDGRLHPDSPGAFKFAFYPFKGKKVKLTIEELKETRSNQQNRAFFGIVVKAFCEYMGYRFSNARDKEFVKNQILIAAGHYTIMRGLGGKEVMIAKPTHNMKAKDFSELYESCQQLGAENGLVIQDPNSPIAIPKPCWEDHDLQS